MYKKYKVTVIKCFM